MKLRVLLAVLLFLPLAGQGDRRPPLAEPSLSPDGAEIAFVSGGDIWTAPAAGGTARLLVSHPATESRPLWSPDGKRLAFTSTRTGGGDVYVLDLASGELKRLTFEEAPERADGWSADGKYVYFTSAAADIAGMTDIFRVPVEGGTPMQYAADRYATEYFAAPSPVAADTIALTAKGTVSGQWWRHGHSHMDESEIWIRRDAASGPAYERLSTGGCKEAWPMWSPDGKQLFYMSDRDGNENLWTRAASAGGTPRQITKFTSGRVLWPSIAKDGKRIVFERDFGIWSVDLASGKASQINIALRGTPAGQGSTRTQLTSGFSDLVLSSDGKKLAFVARGKVFAAGAKEGGTATKLTDSEGVESSPMWSPDNKRLIYTSDRGGVSHLYLYDLAKNAETPLTSGTDVDTSPIWSPDGKSIAFLRGARKVMVLDVESKGAREVATSYFRLPPLDPTRAAAWSPDSKWLAYNSIGNRLFRNVALVPAAGGTPIMASFLPNTFGGSILWSPDGKYLLFDTGQRTENSRVARIDLIPRTPRFREDQFRDLFKDEPPKGPAAPKPEPAPALDKTVKVVAEDIRQRLTLLPIGVDVNGIAISPDGKTLLMSGSAAGQTNLWTYSMDDLSREPAVARQLTSTPGRKSDFSFTPDGKEVYYLENGRIAAIAMDTRVSRPVAVSAELDVDFQKDKGVVFQQAWSYLNSNFYDDKFHGADWQGIRGRLAPYVEGSRTPDETRRVLSLMIGELNASHTGIGAPLERPAATGHLGVRFDRAEYEKNGQLKVTEVLRLSPAEVAGIKVSDVIAAVDGMKIGATTNLNEVLEYKSGRKVNITLGDQREIALSPVSGAQEKALLYRHWVEASRTYVHKASNGRLGYVHIPDMSAGALDQFYLDLDSENLGRDGVVVDIRANNGGFVNVYALDVLSRTPFLKMTPRGFPTVNARTFLGQRSLERPTVLVTNMHSLSDAEDFAEGYRTMKLGKVVGEPTAGWIIYTTNVELLDGSSLRLPSIRITDMAGKNMELNPRPVDVLAVRAMGESYQGKDTQLDVAVRELLKQIGAPAKN